MLLPTQAGSTMIAGIRSADVIVASVGSGSATSVLVAPRTPLILLRPRVTWSGANVTRTAERNAGLVLDGSGAVVLDEALTACSLEEAVHRQLGSACAASGDELMATRAAQRQALRHFWFGDVDGYEELRTWFALLSMRLDGRLRWGGSDAIPRAQLEPLYAAYQRLTPCGPARADTGACTMPLAQPWDHPLIARSWRWDADLGAGARLVWEEAPPSQSCAPL